MMPVNLNTRPILSALMRSGIGALLVTCQVALSLAVLCNALHLVHQRVVRMATPTGIDDANMFAISSMGFTDRFNYEASVREDLAYLRGMSGVVAATPTNAVPLNRGGSLEDIWEKPDHKGPGELVHVLEMDEQGLKTLGVHLEEGRAFRRDEILPPLTKDNSDDFVPEIIVSRSLAQTMFPQQPAVGRVVYDSFGKPATIIGVMDDIISSAAGSLAGAQEHLIVEPRMPLLYGFAYLVRTQPGHRDEVLRTAEQHLSVSNPERVIKWARPLEFFKKRRYFSDRTLELFMVTVAVLLLAVAATGMFGLCMFNVTTRTRQIGIRRALGARRADILLHFMVENALITTGGVSLGCLLALGMSYYLATRYGLPRLNLYYLGGGAVVLWTLGQLAVFHPARRATNVPPSVATRTI